MKRREFLASTAAALCACSGTSRPELLPETARTHDWNLRYAPRMHLLGDDVSVEEHLEIYAGYGFRAFEYNGLPRNTRSKRPRVFAER